MLTANQKLNRMNLARQSLQILRSRTDPVDAVVAQDESWMFLWDPQKKEATKVWIAPGAPRPQKPRIERSTVKTMLVVFIDQDGVNHREFVPDGVGISAQVYADILDHFLVSFKRKRPQHNRSGTWIFLQDGAPARKSRRVTQWLADHGIKSLPHPGYSPDLNPMDYWFFDRIKSTVKRTRFQTVPDLHQAVDHTISQIPAAQFAHAFNRLQDRLRKCIAAQGAYFKEH